jgi:hypothetical protein
LGDQFAEHQVHRALNAWFPFNALELPTFLQFVIGWQSLAGVSLGDGCLAVK